MIGSQTATTLSILSHAALAPPEVSIRPKDNAEANAAILNAFMGQFLLVTKLASSAGPVHEQLLDDEEQEIGAVAERAGDQDRAVHVGELVADLRVDDAVTETVGGADEHLGDDDD